MAEFHRLRHRDEIEEDNNLYYSHHASASSSMWEDWHEDAEILAKTEPNASMPRLDHLSLRDYDVVYEPADDTYLLLDAIQYEFKSGMFDHHFNNGNNENKKTVVLEIGCGTGVASVFFRSQWIKRWETLLDEDDVMGRRNDGSSADDRAVVDWLESYATDINPKAIQVTLQTDSYNNGHAFHEEINPIHVVQCDLATDLLAHLKGKVDILLFNPPYVPTDDSEVVNLTTTTASSSNAYDDNGIDPSPSIITAAWAGGKDGRRVIDRAIPQIAQLLRRPNDNNCSSSNEADIDKAPADGTTTGDESDGSTTGPGGVLYLVTVDDNRPGQLASQLSSSFGLELKPLFRRRAHNEFLTIQKITWKSPDDNHSPEKPRAITESLSSLGSSP